MPEPSRLHRPRAVTFDCWATLIAEGETRSGPVSRARILAEYAGTEVSRARNALQDAWRKHQMLWHRRQAFTGADMTRMALEALGVSLSRERSNELIERLEREILDHEIRALPGSGEALKVLAVLGVRRALICDTGYTPGRVVRELLDRVGLLQYLEVTVFSDEIGVPKPHRRAFSTALERLGVAPSQAVHVGDLRRSDIAGARGAGMGSIRITVHNDDKESGPNSRAGVIDCATAGCEPPCDRPEADAVIATHDELPRALAY